MGGCSEIPLLDEKSVCLYLDLQACGIAVEYSPLSSYKYPAFRRRLEFPIAKQQDTTTFHSQAGSIGPCVLLVE
jgi:hypothetical protein